MTNSETKTKSNPSIVTDFQRWQKLLEELRKGPIEVFHLHRKDLLEVLEGYIDLLEYVEKCANYNAAIQGLSPEEALSLIQWYPSITDVTESYGDGVLPPLPSDRLVQNMQSVLGNIVARKTPPIKENYESQ